LERRRSEMSRCYADIVVHDGDPVDLTSGNSVRIGISATVMAMNPETHDRLAAAHAEAARRMREKAGLPTPDPDGSLSAPVEVPVQVDGDPDTRSAA
jgi:hypothetical protein